MGAQTCKRWGPEGLAPELWRPEWWEGWGPEGWGHRRVGAPKGGAPKGGGPEGWEPKPAKSGGPEGWGPEGWAPEGWVDPKFSVFQCPATFFLPSLGGLLVEFWWCLKRRDPQMCTFGVLGLSCETRRQTENSTKDRT